MNIIYLLKRYFQILDWRHIELANACFTNAWRCGSSNLSSVIERCSLLYLGALCIDGDSTADFNCAFNRFHGARKEEKKSGLWVSRILGLSSDLDDCNICSYDFIITLF